MSGYIPRTFIDELISQTNIVDIVQTRIQLKKSGPNYIACCPFHNEKTPSFNVSPNKQFFHCFGCGISGNVVSFVMAYDRLDFVAAIETIAAHLGIAVPTEKFLSNKNKSDSTLYELLEKANQFYQTQLRQHPQRQTAINYLKNRGLSGAIGKTYQIGYAPPAWDNLLKDKDSFGDARDDLLKSGLLIQKETHFYDFFRHRIMFPIRDRRGRVIGFGGRTLEDDPRKYLNSPETPVFHKSKELYGLYEALQSNQQLQEVIIVEGYMDVIALAQYGITNAVATLGTSTSKDHIRLLLRFTKKIIFCFDGDKAGRSAAWRALETSLSVLQDGLSISFMFLPDGEDPDSLIRKEEAQAFKERIKHAQLLSKFLIAELKQKQSDIESAEGKARFQDLAKSLIKQIPECDFRYFIVEEIGHLLQLDTKNIERLFENKVSNAPAISQEPSPLHLNNLKTVQKTAHPSQLRMRSALRLAILLLLQHPHIIQSVPKNIPLVLEESPGHMLLQELIQLLQNNPGISTGHLLEHWRDHKYFERLSTLAHEPHHVPENGIVEEFLGSLASLKQQYQKTEISQLMNKAKDKNTSLNEKQALFRLIQEKQKKMTKSD